MAALIENERALVLKVHGYLKDRPSMNLVSVVFPKECEHQFAIYHSDDNSVNEIDGSVLSKVLHDEHFVEYDPKFDEQLWFDINNVYLTLGDSLERFRDGDDDEVVSDD